MGGEDCAGYLIAYLQPSLGGRNRAQNNIQHNSDMYMDNKNDTQRGGVELLIGKGGGKV